MTGVSTPVLSEFAAHILEGLSCSEGKRLSPRYFYDDLGSALFEAITLLPEYGLTRADERLLAAHAAEIARLTGPLESVMELGSGSGKKTLHVLRPQVAQQARLTYQPIDVSAAALAQCELGMRELCQVKPVCSDWTDGLAAIAGERAGDLPSLLLFLGSSVGNLERHMLPEFFGSIRRNLRTGDYLLVGADLVKDVEQMIAAYDDPTGVTAAFNLNLLNRINREVGTNFDLRLFAHEARWNALERRIEMHLLACRDQVVRANALDMMFRFRAGETIWTESSHKFDAIELDRLAAVSGFEPAAAWSDVDWPFTEVLWRAVT